MIFTIISAIVVLGILIIVHELGHFMVAKALNIKVLEFSIGMGPKIFQLKKKETDYSLRGLPLGGYVKMEGEDESSDDDRSFSNKPVPSRIAVLFAGSFMNFLFAIIVLTAVFFHIGMITTTIDEVNPGSPAELGGIEAGDEIYAIEGERTYTSGSVNSLINRHEGEVTIEVLRDGETLSLTMEPEFSEEMERRMISVRFSVEHSLGAAMRGSVRETVGIITEIFGFLGRIFTGEANVSEEVAGPVGIVSLVGDATRAGFLNVALLASFISINLGIMNLLPIPALDGSRIIFALIEALRGKPLDPEKEGMVHLVGFGLLMVLLLLITYQDILRLF